MFKSRFQAGQLLADRLSRFRGQPSVLVLGLARGGVPVARAFADALGVSIDVFLVRKLGVPWQPELGFGAVAEGGICVLDSALIQDLRLTREDIEEVVAREEREVQRRSRIYRGARPSADVAGRDVIVVDDGMAMGSTMLAAVRALQKRHPRRIIVAVPVGSRASCEAVSAEADEVVCLYSPEPFYSVGTWYEDFREVDDSAVQDALATVPASH